MLRKEVCVAGKNAIAVNFLIYAYYLKKFYLYACPCNSDNGEDTWQPSLKKTANLLGIEIIDLNQARRKKNLIFLSLEYDQILDVNSFNSKLLFNVHFSLLPSYKGCFTSIWPIIKNEKKTGVTLHEIDQGIDTGNIISQREFLIGEEMTSNDLYKKYNKVGVELLKNNFLDLINNKYKSFPQQPNLSSYFSRKSLSIIGQEIIFPKTAYEVKTFVRALYFPEYQHARFNNKDIFKCNILNQRSSQKPGETIYADNEKMVISTIDYDIELLIKCSKN